MTAAAEIATIGGTGTLAVRADQTWWTDSQAEMLRAMGVDKDVTRGELLAFLHLCQKTGLDPATRQVYLIGRMDRRAGRKVYTPQTGIDGYRVIAHRVAAVQGEHFAYEDQQWCGDDGRWSDVWLSSSPPAAARVVVVREGNRFPGVALWAEYRQTNRDGALTGLWASMPAAQLAKCAEALALRKAFPNDLAGIYTAEEMGQADNPPVVATTVVQSAPARVTAAEILGAHTSGGDVTPPVPGSAPDDVPSPPEPPLPPNEGDAKGRESSHGGHDVLASGDGSEGRSLSPDREGKGTGAIAAERPGSTSAPQQGPRWRAMQFGLSDMSFPDRAARLAYVSEVIGRPVESTNDLTYSDIGRVLVALDTQRPPADDSEPDATLDGTA